MKKYVYGICALLVMAACQKNDEPVININGENKVVVTANIKDTDDTRVVLTPTTDNEGNPIVKVDWDESDETFFIYNANGEYESFVQIPGTNKFEGNLPAGDSQTYVACYNCYMKNSKVSYDISMQDGTLNKDYIMMMGQTNVVESDEKLLETVDFDHMTFILKPTFKFDGNDVDASINRIVMENVNAVTVNSGEQSTENHTLTVAPSMALDDIYIILSESDAYVKDHVFDFTITTTDGTKYKSSLKLPKSLEAGKYYTATIPLQLTDCYLPTGSTFSSFLKDFVKADQPYYRIEFVANSDNTEGTVLPGTVGCPAYLVANNTIIKIHTPGNQFFFNPDSSHMFYGNSTATLSLRSIAEIDFANCNTSKVVNMKGMFEYCSQLYKIENLTNFDTSNVENMSYMFYHCGTNSPQSAYYDQPFDVSRFNTSKVTNMEGMFYDYNNKLLDISNFDMSNVKNVREMFNRASNLEKLTLGRFNIPNECDLYNIFLSTGSTLGSGKKTQIIVKNQSTIDRFNAANTGIDTAKAEYVLQ